MRADAPSLTSVASPYEYVTISIGRRIREDSDLSYENNETARLVAERLKYLRLDAKRGVGGGTTLAWAVPLRR